MNKTQLWTIAWTTPMLTLGFVASLTQASAANTVNITCNTNASIPTVIASPPEQGTGKNVTILSFIPEYFSPKDAVQNCQNTAKILQSLYKTDSASYLTNDKVNSKPVVCVVERRGLSCDREKTQILFSLGSTVNSSQALYQMLGSDFKQAQPPDARTVSRIYSDIKPKSTGRRWWPF
ncbi:COP23 domain-containing protein [Brasilonema sp. UFV-L1]|uniref:COP23 domain-containing protein n=1 Tax=Brasilonema sp. UFV-L1 TaxID=2234130 RepID=UPI00145F6FC8|nr:COP23 domain-containing protein [Brasilonema sp. UFV-L1]NMG09689.1 hypothetical protein [Brasilonema sp. UFV-L1]